MADDDSDESDEIRDYDEHNDQISDAPINVVPEAKPSVFPSQKCLGELLFKLIHYSFELQKKLKKSEFKFKRVDFQVRFEL